VGKNKLRLFSNSWAVKLGRCDRLSLSGLEWPPLERGLVAAPGWGCSRCCTGQCCSCVTLEETGPHPTPAKFRQFKYTAVSNIPSER